MLVAIDAVGIRGHGGAAVLCELLHWLPKVRPEWSWRVFLLDRKFRKFDEPVVSDKISFECPQSGNTGFERVRWVCSHLPERLLAFGANVVFSFANIGNPSPPVPQVVFCHQPNAFLPGGIPRQALFKRARLLFLRNRILQGARSSRAMIVQTETMRRRILEIEPCLQGRISVIPSGYRTPSENPHIRSEKKTLVDNASRPRLIYVSHPSEHKNHISLVRAMPNILQAFPSAKLLLTLEERWPSDRRYSSFVKRIQKEITLLGISQQIVWLGLLNPDEVNYALYSSDLTVFPSLTESFGLGLVESLAAECPVASADLSYAHDVCDNAAVYFAPEDPEDIARVVMATCCDKAMLEQLKTAGRKRKNRFSYQRIAEKIAQVLESAAEVLT